MGVSWLDNKTAMSWTLWIMYYALMIQHMTMPLLQVEAKQQYIRKSASKVFKNVVCYQCLRCGNYPACALPEGSDTKWTCLCDSLKTSTGMDIAGRKQEIRDRLEQEQAASQK